MDKKYSFDVRSSPRVKTRKAYTCKANGRTTHHKVTSTRRLEFFSTANSLFRRHVQETSRNIDERGKSQSKSLQITRPGAPQSADLPLNTDSDNLRTRSGIKKIGYKSMVTPISERSRIIDGLPSSSSDSSSFRRVSRRARAVVLSSAQSSPALSRFSSRPRTELS